MTDPTTTDPLASDGLAPPREPSATEVFEIRDEEIDVARIMARVQERVREKRSQGGYRDEPWLIQPLEPAGQKPMDGSLVDRLAMLKMIARIDLEGEAISSHRPFTGQVVVWVKQWTRFWIRRYTDSIFYEQNHINAEQVDMLSQMSRQVDELSRKVEELEGRLADVDTPGAPGGDGD